MTTNYKYEYSMKNELSGLAAKYICIPRSIITNKSLSTRRLSILSYFLIRNGLDDTLEFSVPSFIKWINCKSDLHLGGLNEKIVNDINMFKEKGFLEYDKLNKTGYIDITVNYGKLNNLYSHEGFAVLYVDEINAIMNYKGNIKDTKLNSSTLLLVLAYMRSMIYKRSNKLRPEEYTGNLKQDIQARKTLHPEAYSNFYKNIAEEINIPTPTLIKAVNILETNLGLLITKELSRTKNDKGEYRTRHTIFANTYKREGKYLLASGNVYSKPELDKKVEAVKKYYE